MKSVKLAGQRVFSVLAVLGVAAFAAPPAAAAPTSSDLPRGVHAPRPADTFRTCARTTGFTSITASGSGSFPRSGNRACPCRVTAAVRSRKRAGRARGRARAWARPTSRRPTTSRRSSSAGGKIVALIDLADKTAFDDLTGYRKAEGHQGDAAVYRHGSRAARAQRRVSRRSTRETGCAHDARRRRSIPAPTARPGSTWRWSAPLAPTAASCSSASARPRRTTRATTDGRRSSTPSRPRRSSARRPSASASAAPRTPIRTSSCSASRQRRRRSTPRACTPAAVPGLRRRGRLRVHEPGLRAQRRRHDLRSLAELPVVRARRHRRRRNDARQEAPALVRRRGVERRPGGPGRDDERLQHRVRDARRGNRRRSRGPGAPSGRRPTSRPPRRSHGGHSADIALCATGASGRWRGRAPRRRWSPRS